MSDVLNKPAFQALIASLTDLDPAATTWADDPQPFIDDQIELAVTSIAMVGVDEHRTVLGPPGYAPTDLVTTELGNRLVTVTVKAKVYSPGNEAGEFIDRVRTRIRAASVRDALNAMGLAFVWSSPAIRRVTVEDNRRVSVAASDFQFNAVASWVSSIKHDRDPLGTYIDTVNTNDIVPGSLS